MNIQVAVRERLAEAFPILAARGLIPCPAPRLWGRAHCTLRCRGPLRPLTQWALAVAVLAFVVDAWLRAVS